MPPVNRDIRECTKWNHLVSVCISFDTTFEGGFYLTERKNTSASCRNVFKNGGTQPTKRDYTRIWIQLINELERRKGGAAGPEK